MKTLVSARKAAGAIAAAFLVTANPAHGETLPVVDLLRASKSGQATAAAEEFATGKRKLSQSDPDWPTLTYLLGEIHLRRGQIEQAREQFIALTSWAGSKPPGGPYSDAWGGSGVVAVGLWRWLQILKRHGAATSKEVEAVVRLAPVVMDSRLGASMVRTGFLPSLPRLEEETRRLLAQVAWKAGRADAGTLFLDFLAVDSSGKLDDTDQAIQQSLLKKGTVAPPRLDLFRARRLLGLMSTEDQRSRAQAMLKRLWDNESVPSDVRAEAGYEWANARRLQRDKTELLRVLDSVLALEAAGPVAEQALYRRGTTHNRAGGPRDFDAFRSDMLGLVERFPDGVLVDDALFQIASEYLFRGEIDAAEGYFARLRAHRGPNDFADSAYFLPALGFIGRGSKSDHETADRLLAEYLERYVDGVFRLRCLFWRARIAERAGASARARGLFEKVVAEAPYDYYALRARMHLESGAAAAGQILASPDSRSRSGLRESFRASRVETQLASKSIYHRRLAAAAAGGLYKELLAAGEQYSGRLDEIPLDSLDASGALPAVALLLALRQDAMAARDGDPTPDNWLRLGGMLGAGVGDWLVALEVTTAFGADQRVRALQMQRDSRYLATMYPDPSDLKLAETLARAAWPIEGSSSLSQSMMYAIVRQESRFYPRAVSQVGALGLFQFMPELFDRLNRKWQLVDKGSAGSSGSYLLDPARNVQLWVRWSKAEFPVNRPAEIPQALMKHHAGLGNVSGWEAYWQKLGIPQDLEYRVETARFAATRNFVRSSLRDLAIVEAAGLFDGKSQR